MTVWRLLMWTLALAFLAWSVASVPPEASVAGWIGLPLVGIALAAMMDGAAQWSLRNPHKQTLNLPQADDLMALPVDYRMPVLRRVATVAYVTAIVILISFVVLQAGEAVAASGQPSDGWTALGVGICLLGPLAAAVWGITTISNEIARQKRAAEGAA